MTVDYATADGAADDIPGAGTAVAGKDYTAAMGTLTFASGETSKMIAVAVLDDDVFEGTELLSLSLSGAVGATVDDGTGTGAIHDNEPPPKLTIRGNSAVEGDPLVFDVTLSPAVGVTVSTDYLTELFPYKAPPALKQAESGTDYVSQSGTLVFSPGETSKTVSVVVSDDTDVEPDEAVVVTLRSPLNAVFRQRAATGPACPWSVCRSECCDCGTILNDDVAASTEILLSATPSAVSEGAGSTEVEVTASLDGGARTAATTVTVTVTGAGRRGRSASRRFRPSTW